MKIKTVCHFCRIEEDSDWVAIIELDKWPYIEMKCNRGHRQRYVLSTELYVLLFEQATRCLVDGYYREAVCTYNAALERFFEYAIEMMLDVKTNVDISAVWKLIPRSEQQIGAYYTLWIATFDEMPVKLNNKKTEFRNDVVHNGRLVSRQEAEEFGEYVFNCIVPNAEKIKNIYPGMVINKVRRIIRKCEKDFQKEANDPIFVDFHGSPSVLATGSIDLLCLLNNPRIKTYTDCLAWDFSSPYLSIK